MNHNTLTQEDVIKTPTSELFDPQYSPIRILFHGDDPAKDRTLPFVVEVQSHVRDLGDDPTVMIQTTWLDAYKLLAGSVRVGIRPFFDSATAQTRISGYELIRAGLLTVDCEVSVTLTDEERRAGHLSKSPTMQEAMDAVMSLFLYNLAQFVIETGDQKLAAVYAELAKLWPVVYA